MSTITKNNHIRVQIDAHPTLISILQITHKTFYQLVISARLPIVYTVICMHRLIGSNIFFWVLSLSYFVSF